MTFHELLSSEDYEFRYVCGVSKPSSRILFTEKDKVISAMCLHYTIMVSLAELEQLKRGFSIQKFIILIQSYPALLRKVFEPEDGSITAEFIQDLFVPFFSLKGSNQRALEESLIMTWIQYLQCLEGNFSSVCFEVD